MSGAFRATGQEPCQQPDADRDHWSSDSVKEINVAKKACRERCPSVRDCLQWALSFPQDMTGVFGGTSRSERRALLAQRNRAIRAWASSRGIHLVPTKPIPTAVVDAWVAAQAPKIPARTR